MQPFFEATQNNDIEKIKNLLSSKEANIDLQDENGYTALMHATLNENFDLVKFFLEKGANPNIYNNKLSNALLLSLQESKNEKIVDLLAYYGSDLSKLNQDALSICLTKGYINIAKCFLEKYYDVNSKKIQTLMLWAIQNGKEVSVQVLLESGFNVNNTYNNEPFLYMALRLKQVKICQYFIENGYDIQSHNISASDLSYTSLFIKALCTSNAEILQYLFSKGLLITDEDYRHKNNYLNMITDKECFKVALNNGFKINEDDLISLIENNSVLAALACLKSIKPTQKTMKKIMSKLSSLKEFELIKDLVCTGYTVSNSIKKKMPTHLAIYANAIEEKDQFEKILNQQSNINSKKVKI